jgi:hypothetical protein
MARIRALTAGLAVAGVLAGSQVAGAERTTLAVMVAACPEAGVDWEMVARATHVTSEVYRRVGVDLAWRGSKLSTARTPLPEIEGTSAIRVIWIRMLCESQVPRTTRLATALGYSTAGVPFANVAYERVEEYARRRQVQRPLVLGYVMAHEIGHVLLEARPHGPTGLMREALDTQLCAQRLLWFTDDEGLAVRTGLSRDRTVLAER